MNSGSQVCGLTRRLPRSRKDAIHSLPSCQRAPWQPPPSLAGPSGMAVGGGYVWMVANAPPEGVFQVDMNSKLISHRQIPLGPAGDGGGCHGALWQDGKLWIASLRLRGNLRVDPKTWEPEFMIPFYQAPDRTRYHGIAWDNGTRSE